MRQRSPMHPDSSAPRQSFIKPEMRLAALAALLLFAVFAGNTQGAKPALTLSAHEVGDVRIGIPEPGQ
jgi:hypothetical protein